MPVPSVSGRCTQQGSNPCCPAHHHSQPHHHHHHHQQQCSAGHSHSAQTRRRIQPHRLISLEPVPAPIQGPPRANTPPSQAPQTWTLPSPSSHGRLMAELATVASLLQGAAAAHAEPSRQALNSAAATLGAQAAPGLVEGAKYVPSAYEPGWEVWVGFFAGVIPFAIGSWEFGKRIVIQQRCELCAGKGLVPSTNAGAKYLRKCPECGGFFPWISWKMFLTSNATPGNGGPLQQPKGQKSVFYEVPAAAPTREQVEAARAKYMAQGATATQQQEQQGATAGQQGGSQEGPGGST